jgi:hypothetical protein
MKKYDISLDTIDKTLNVKIGGMFDQSDAESFIKDFTGILATIKAIDFDLVFDASELSVSKPEMLPMLEGCFKMYKDIGFKKVVANVGSNITLKMQLGRIARTAGLDLKVN